MDWAPQAGRAPRAGPGFPGREPRRGRAMPSRPTTALPCAKTCLKAGCRGAGPASHGPSPPGHAAPRQIRPAHLRSGGTRPPAGSRRRSMGCAGGPTPACPAQQGAWKRGERAKSKGQSTGIRGTARSLASVHRGRLPAPTMRVEAAAWGLTHGTHSKPPCPNPGRGGGENGVGREDLKPPHDPGHARMSRVPFSRTKQPPLPLLTPPSGA